MTPEQSDRRAFLVGLMGATIVGLRSPVARAQGKAYRIAVANPGGVLDDSNLYVKLLVPSLQKRGYTRGQNLELEAPFAGVSLQEVFQRLKADNVDVVVVVGYPTAVAAKASGIPTVVASGAGDPIATGLVASLARPGGNITGISDVASTLSTKRLQLLKEVSPTLRRVAMLWNKDDLGMSLRYEASAKAAQELGVTVQALGVREPNDFNDAFTAMDKDPPDAILMVSDSLTLLNRKRVFEYAFDHKLPAIYEAENIARDGGLMSYGADQRESLDRAAYLADRIFKGAKPADLPFEEPTRYLFVINLKTAKAMGLTIPNALLALADDVIE